jgi:hypothetical protein
MEDTGDLIIEEFVSDCVRSAMDGKPKVGEEISGERCRKST